ncbi:taste receptor type 1 member 1-like [Heptranchias perlo]|uniref:taste receptor type 1 member 1-like n=1 Tax=Heptranchias perlo TaxID=212740 RepID=UPI00355A5FE1
MLLIVLLVLIAHAPGHSGTEGGDSDSPWTEFELPGDYITGGLFSIHFDAQYHPDKPKTPKCKSFASAGYRHFQAMRFAVEEINNSSELLPNVTLGYLIFDNCASPINVKAVFDFALGNSRWGAEECQGLVGCRPRVSAILGPWGSEAALAIASVLHLFHIPQISYGASNEKLSDKVLFPSFFRTIPSDRNQVEAMVLLIQRFGWNWISVIASDNQYGQDGKHRVIELASTRGICVAYQGIIHDHETTSEHAVSKMITHIGRSNPNVIVLFSDLISARTFFQAAVDGNITGKTWILSESVSEEGIISEIPNVKKTGTFLGISVKRGPMPGFGEFVAKAIAAQNPVIDQDHSTSARKAANSNISAQENCAQICTECRHFTSASLQTILGPSGWGISFNVYSAMYAVAHALHHLLQCDSGSCDKSRIFLPSQLLESLKRVNFTLHNNLIYFDENGNPSMGYEVIVWDTENGSLPYKVIGSYTPSPGRLTINQSLIKWNSAVGTVPTSNCSRECEPGQRKRRDGFHPCCFLCENCPAGTSQVNAECEACSLDQWSPEKSLTCYNRSMTYLRWDSSVSIVLSVMSGAGLLVTTGITLIFILYLNTPVVKAAGGKLCFLMLVSLACGCCSVFLFIGKPSNMACSVRWPLFTVSFTACLACIFVRSFQIVCIFKMATKLPKAYDYWVKYNGQYVFVVGSTSLSVIHCSVWMVQQPVVTVINYRLSQREMFPLCTTDNDLTILMLGFVYIGVLSLLCFVFAFLGKDLPKNYNEAKCISFSMVLFIVSWSCFILIVISGFKKHLPMAQALATLLSLYGIVAAYFLPKCYIILFKPKCNTTAFFQNCIQDYTKKRAA